MENKASTIVNRNGSPQSGDGWEDNNDTNEKYPIMNSLDIESPTTKMTATTQESAMSQEEPPLSATTSERTTCCSKMWHYGGVVEAKGYALNAMGRGAAVMSNGENPVVLVHFAFTIKDLHTSVY